jgi:hypothetical protein
LRQNEEFEALQQGVTNKQKMMQQQINRLNQEVLELKRVRDVLTKDYQISLHERLELGKADAEGKVTILTGTVEKLSHEVGDLRQELDQCKTKNHDLEQQMLQAVANAELARAELSAMKRQAELKALEEKTEEKKEEEEG